MNTFLIRKKSYPVITLACLLLSLPGLGQEKSEPKKVLPSGYSKSVSAGINISIPEFSQTHQVGVGANFSWSKKRLGLMEKKPSKAFGFIAEGGIDYYFGNKETVSSYPYTYNNFTYLHTYAGIIYNLSKKGNINITTGPALGLEGGYTTLFWGANLAGAYYLNEKIAITPVIQFMKDPDSYDPLLSIGIKGSWVF